MKTNSRGHSFSHCISGVVVVLVLILSASEAHSLTPLDPPIRPQRFAGFVVGYDINNFHSLDINYPGLIKLDDVSTQWESGYHAGLTFDFNMSESGYQIWEVNTSILVYQRSFSARKSNVAVPLEDCGDALVAAGEYNATFRNLEFNISAILSRRLWQTEFFAGVGLGLGVTRQSREREQLSVRSENLPAGLECGIASTEKLIAHNGENVADILNVTDDFAVLDPQLIVTMRYDLMPKSRLMVTPVVSANFSMLPVGGDEIKWRRSSISIALEFKTRIL